MGAPGTGATTVIIGIITTTVSDLAKGHCSLLAPISAQHGYHCKVRVTGRSIRSYCLS
jgi:hypothetical protein